MEIENPLSAQYGVFSWKTNATLLILNKFLFAFPNAIPGHEEQFEEVGFGGGLWTEEKDGSIRLTGKYVYGMVNTGAVYQPLEAFDFDRINLGRRAIVLSRDEIEQLLTSEAKRTEARNEGHPNYGALSRLTLPLNAAKEQVRDYVRDIMNISRKQERFSSEDPQIPMLALVGHDNMDVLLQPLTMENDRSRTYIGYAMTALARDSDKAMILDALPRARELVAVVVARGWVDDAKKILIEGLKVRPNSLPIEWIEAVASLRDPGTYESLKSYLVEGADPWRTYVAIGDIPGLDLYQPAADLWERHKKEEDEEGKLIALIALENGQVGALGKAISILDKDKDKPYLYHLFQSALVTTTGKAYVDAASGAYVRKWYEENKDRLLFDQVTKAFVVRNVE